MKRILPLSVVYVLAFLVSYTVPAVHCQTFCPRQATLRWQSPPRAVSLNLTLTENICMDLGQCWDTRGAPWGRTAEPPRLGFPQICPLQLQRGDRLLVSADETVRSYGVRLAGVSAGGFESCSVDGDGDVDDRHSGPGRSLFRGDGAEGEPEDAGRLVPGLHYFVAVARDTGDTRLCELGLRLNVSVKRQLCQSSPLVRLCSGNGICQTDPREETYRCHCRRHYSGTWCERFDACLDNPCGNKGVCLSNGSGDAGHRTYKCLCPPHFTGVNCSEIIGRENCERVCQNASCVQASPMSFKCICETGFSGPGCEERSDACRSDPCVSGGTCVRRGDGFSCRCPEGFGGPTCAVDCAAYDCHHGDACPDDASACACADGGEDPACGRRPGPCLPSPCLNNASCVSQGDDYACRCVGGFAGRTCEEVVDYCSLLRINCPDEGVCVSVIGGYKCACAPGRTGEFCQHTGDACVAHSHRCVNGATCVAARPVTPPPQFTCVCPPGFTGRYCERRADACRSSPCRHNGTCSDLQGDYRCQCLDGFLGEACEVDVDACLLPGNTCPPETQCVDLPGGLNCTCPLGYAGPHCEASDCLGSQGPLCPVLQVTDDCSGSPCAEGATCLDSPITGYRCVCPPGYGGFEGLNCDADHDECTHGYCSNNATCIDLVADYECICPLGFTGFHGAGCASVCLCDPEGSVSCEALPGSYRCVCRHGRTGGRCETPPAVRGCADGPCGGGSACVELPAGFRCDCLPGLTGQFCEVNTTDGCDAEPCGVLSICQQALGGYSCFCAPGFIGTRCEVEVDECLSQPCQNGGSCSDGLNSFSCQCPSGITGEHCEVKAGGCASSPCLRSGATCVDLAHGYRCVCSPGFTGSCIDQPGNYLCHCVAPFKGPDCEFLPCEAANPCDNGGTCVAEPDLRRYPPGFRCLCGLGHSGPRCEGPRGGECRSQPCLNDAVDGFYCLCSPGYVGLRCEHDVDDCVSNSCSNNSLCRDLHLGYECECRAGWEGPSCQQDVDECASQPCPNDATCVDLLGGYE
ncbi:hypothetical protein NHX12_022888 [Muraenolepis orangiensis]|uniref:EGF-like domain-containing protein n=1 Tax=Muraenolepis orangiensis TaxID=630683 RepID=A0A9Q0IRQ6_9TELE|nr:hypothetical protein NHX12_022888 [Muraenolepis orangiensis]